MCVCVFILVYKVSKTCLDLQLGHPGPWTMAPCADCAGASDCGWMAGRARRPERPASGTLRWERVKTPMLTVLRLGIGVTQADPSRLDFDDDQLGKPGLFWVFFGTLEGSNNIQPTNIEHIDAHSTAYIIIYNYIIIHIYICI